MLERLEAAGFDVIREQEYIESRWGKYEGEDGKRSFLRLWLNRSAVLAAERHE